MYPPFGVATAPHMFFSSVLGGPQHILSFPLGQHILDYDPPRGFSIPSFAMYDGSFDPYDHMLHFNQAMILNAEDDRLLCKVFPASLKGPALSWFHKLPRGSIISFGDLWAAFVSQNLCSVRQKGKTNPSGTSHVGSDKMSSILIFTVWIRSCKTSQEALGRPPRSSSLYPSIRPQLWKNCISRKISFPHWKTTFEPPRRL